ncbi:MAG: hypothetical protein KJ043_12570, partial [Anaerolineae bacterium]|nr:hypothetical protein [Anaerolineae bacterium]
RKFFSLYGSKRYANEQFRGGYTRFALIVPYSHENFLVCTGGLEALASYIRPMMIQNGIFIPKIGQNNYGQAFLRVPRGTTQWVAPTRTGDNGGDKISVSSR